VYTVNGTKFKSYLKAVNAAHAIGADVLDENGVRRWTPAPKAASKTRHVILNADGTETPFSRVK